MLLTNFNHSDWPSILKGRIHLPFGTAAGLDKNGEVLRPFPSCLVSFEPGTVVLHPREGNPQPRVYADVQNCNVYNAQGFPSNGLDVFSANLRRYRDQDGEAPVYTSICGIPNESNVSGVRTF